MDGGIGGDTGQSNERGFAFGENSDSLLIDFTVSPYGGPIPPVIVPLSPEAQEFDPAVLAEHALLRILRRLVAGAIRLLQQSTAQVGLMKKETPPPEFDREHV